MGGDVFGRVSVVAAVPAATSASFALPIMPPDEVAASPVVDGRDLKSVLEVLKTIARTAMEQLSGGAQAWEWNTMNLSLLIKAVSPLLYGVEEHDSLAVAGSAATPAASQSTVLSSGENLIRTLCVVVSQQLIARLRTRGTACGNAGCRE